MPRLVFAAVLAAAPFTVAQTLADDLSNSSQCSGYSSIDECVDDAATAARDEAIDDAKSACSNIDSSDGDAQQECEDAVEGAR